MENIHIHPRCFCSFEILFLSRLQGGHLEFLCDGTQQRSPPAADRSAVDARGRPRLGGAAAARPDPLHAAAARAAAQPADGQRRAAARSHPESDGKHSTSNLPVEMSTRPTVYVLHF